MDAEHASTSSDDAERGSATAPQEHDPEAQRREHEHKLRSHLSQEMYSKKVFLPGFCLPAFFPRAEGVAKKGTNRLLGDIS